MAVTGANGRLGRALVSALEDAPFTGPFGPIAWERKDFDLDAPDTVHTVLDRDRPEVVVHAAAWTDVDGCARDPRLAMARNGAATGALARACVERGVDLVVISTNEVFDGRRTDGRGYAATDPIRPGNPYGESKAAGERAAAEAFDLAGEGLSPFVPRDAVATGPQLAVVRTAWLYGPPGGDFPDKIVAAAERARASGEPLRVVGDEYGDPSSTADVAEAVVELLGAPSFAGIHHLVDPGRVSRATWARALLAALGPQVPIEEVPAATWPRPSAPPRWGCSSRRRCRPGSRCVPGSRRSPMISPGDAVAGRQPWHPAAEVAMEQGFAALDGTDIADVRVGRLRRHEDGRGAFREVWRASWYPTLGPDLVGLPGAAFVQANVSTSSAGVLRGLHFHRRQLDHWVVLEGRALVALVDIRPLLTGGDRPIVGTRPLEADEWVSIPTGVAHGFLAEEPLTLLYLVTNAFDGSDELGFAWDDPDAAVPWPRVEGTSDGRPILSDRDRSNPSLRELVASIRG